MYHSGNMHLPATEDRVKYDQPPFIKAVIFREDTSIIAKFKLLDVDGTAGYFTCVGRLLNWSSSDLVVNGQGTVKFNH